MVGLVTVVAMEGETEEVLVVVSDSEEEEAVKAEAAAVDLEAAVSVTEEAVEGWGSEEISAEAMDAAAAADLVEKVKKVERVVKRLFSRKSSIPSRLIVK